MGLGCFQQTQQPSDICSDPSQLVHSDTDFLRAARFSLGCQELPNRLTVSQLKIREIVFFFKGYTQMFYPSRAGQPALSEEAFSQQKKLKKN